VGSCQSGHRDAITLDAPLPVAFDAACARATVRRRD
jgi:hypothetical protein